MDVFSFGVVLWELWTGKEPYDGLNYHALYHQMTTSLKSMRPALPGSQDWDNSSGPEPAPGYQALMERCWSVSFQPFLPCNSYFPVQSALEQENHSLKALKTHCRAAHRKLKYTCSECHTMGFICPGLSIQLLFMDLRTISLTWL